MLVEASPQAIEAIGRALGEVIKPAADAVGQGLSSIDEIKIVDLAGANGNGHGNVLSQFANMPAETIINLLEKLKAVGGGQIIEAIAEKAGLNVNGLLNSGGNGETVSPPPPVVKPDTKGKDATE
jgi:uncharacterized membrane protein YqiK